MSLHVYRIYDSGVDWLVRGTDVLEEAMAALVVHEEVFDDAPTAGENDLEPRLVAERAGWFRFNPCSPQMCGEHGWHLGYARGPGRGNFLGVYGRVEWEEVVYDVDIDA